jgi:hypothetical protein
MGLSPPAKADLLHTQLLHTVMQHERIPAL